MFLSSGGGAFVVAAVMSSPSAVSRCVVFFWRSIKDYTRPASVRPTMASLR